MNLGKLKLRERKKTRKEVRKEEEAWLKSSLLLRGKKPGETLKLSFDLLDFVEKLGKARKG